jgi:hypothetical protein
MYLRNKQNMRCGRLAVLLCVMVFACPAFAQVTLLVEEPFGHFGAFTATGHAAVYLSRICASSPTILRRCEPGEPGVVISRYNKVGGRDWIAIPLMPYLYAVETADDVPLFVDAKVIAFLRNDYRRRHLEDVAPDRADGEPPEGNWTQLVGSAYDRLIYGFEIDSSEEQDDEFIREYNARPNQPRFNLLVHNCADFARGVVNFYDPKAVGRNWVADVGITTPKQLAKSLTKYSKRHPELELSTFVIPQVPGVVERSTQVRGVLESLLKSKKYLLPLAVFHPIVTGVAAVVYIGDGRFDPGRNAMVMDPAQGLQWPLTAEQRHFYQEELNKLLAEGNPGLKALQSKRAWTTLASEPRLDAGGGPVLKIRSGEKSVEMGLSRNNLVRSNVPQALTEELLTARLLQELRNGSGASQRSVEKDWNLLEQVLADASKAPPVCDGHDGATCVRGALEQSGLRESASAAALR